MARGAGRSSRHGGPQGRSGAPDRQGHEGPQRSGLQHDGPGHDGPGHDGPRHNGPGATFSFGKALAIVVVAVALGVYLLSLGNGHGATATASSLGSTTASSTTTTTAAPTTTTPPATPSKSVLVLVANASHTTGIATYYSGKLSAAGWGAVTPENATTVVTTSTVYFATGQQANADAVASELGLPVTDVQALGSTVPVVNLAGADVVVVAGVDLASKVPATASAG